MLGFRLRARPSRAIGINSFSPAIYEPTGPARKGFDVGPCVPRDGIARVRLMGISER